MPKRPSTTGGGARRYSRRDTATMAREVLSPLRGTAPSALEFPPTQRFPVLLRDRLVSLGHSEAPQPIARLSNTCRLAYENGTDEALVTMVEFDGVMEPWVQRAIDALRNQQTDLRTRQRATAQLKLVGNALHQTGRGRTSRRTSEEQCQAKRNQVRDAKALARFMKLFEKHLESCRGQPDAIGKAEKLVLREESRLDDDTLHRVNPLFKARVAAYRKGSSKTKR